MNHETVNDYGIDIVQEVNKVMPTFDLDKNGLLKRKINNLIWEEGSADLTLSDAELMACRIFKMLCGND